MRELRPYQTAAINKLAQKASLGKSKLVFQLATGGGKCLGKDTPVLMYDGSIKKVQDIVSGELLMGPDSSSRKVLSTCTGSEMLYRVIPTKGEPYIVNESHILSLKITNIKQHQLTAPDGQKYKAGDVVNISIKNYLKASKTFKHVTKGYSAGVIDFKQSCKLSLSSYILGVWLGDGNSRNCGFATKDNEIVDALHSYAGTIGCSIREELYQGKCPMYYFVGGTSRGVKGGSNPFLNLLKQYHLINNKHIPHVYKTASREDRLLLLAGLADSDGYVHRSGYEFVFVNEKLADDVCFISRSLGFAAYKKPCIKKCYNNGITGNYFRISIVGNCDLVPAKLKRRQAPERKQIKSHLLTGIKVERLGIGDYYGFEIDGDHLFMLGDFTVTHNTVSFAGLIHRYLQRQQRRVLILVHREELLRQAYRTLFEWYEITAAPITAGTNYLPNVMVYIAMVETANNRLKKNPNYFGNIGLVIVDECHLGNFKKLYDQFPNALIIGFTATPISSSKKDPLKNHFEDIVCGCDIPDLIRSKSLVPNKTYHIKNIDRKELAVKNGEFDEKQMGTLFSSSRHVQNCLHAYQQYAIDTKTIVFNCNIEHSKKVTETFLSFGYKVRHLDGEADPRYRQETLLWFKNTPDAILCNVGILTTGFDEPSVQTVIINKSTMSLPLWLQMTGRGSRPYPGKDFFTIIDMGGNALYHGDWCMSRDWADMFHNPEKPRTGGEAPQKVCKGCEALIHASIKICRFCGADNSATPVYDDVPVKFELLSMSHPVNIDVAELINANSSRSPYYTLHQIKQNIVTHAHRVWAIKKLDDTSAKRIHGLYQEKVKEWCTMTGKQYNRWHKETTASWLNEELKKVFKWEPVKT